MVEKKEGATMNCRNCGTLLTCHEKIYPETGQLKERRVMQWQNEDSSAHYKTKDGKTFTCNISEGSPQTPEQEKNTLTQYQNEQSLSQGNGQTNIGLATIDEKLSRLESKIETFEGIIQSILHIVADIKIAQNKEEKS